MGHHGIFRSTNDPEGVEELRTLGEARRRRSARRRGRRTTGEAESLGGRHPGSIQLQHEGWTSSLPFPRRSEFQNVSRDRKPKSTNSQKNHSKFVRFRHLLNVQIEGYRHNTGNIYERSIGKHLFRDLF